MCVQRSVLPARTVSPVRAVPLLRVGTSFSESLPTLLAWSSELRHAQAASASRARELAVHGTVLGPPTTHSRGQPNLHWRRQIPVSSFSPSRSDGAFRIPLLVAFLSEAFVALARQCQYLLSDSKRNCLQSHLFTGILQLYDRERDESADDLWEDVRLLIPSESRRRNIFSSESWFAQVHSILCHVFWCCTHNQNWRQSLCQLGKACCVKLATEPLSTWQGLQC